jgi:hypothetical protein
MVCKLKYHYCQQILITIQRVPNFFFLMVKIQVVKFAEKFITAHKTDVVII